MYLNFDMIASPNAGYFTYDGNQSTAVGRDQAIPRVPEDPAGIERTLVAYLDSQGKPAEDTFFDGRSDYDGFTTAGIPAKRIVRRGGGEDVRRAGREVGRHRRRPVRRTITRAPTPWIG